MITCGFLKIGLFSLYGYKYRIQRLIVGCSGAGRLGFGYKRQIMGIPLDRTGVEICRGVGCSRCLRTGYFDRIGVFEFVPFDAGLSNLVMEKATMDVLHGYAVEHGAITLRDDATAKVREGLTTLEEALRVTRQEE